MSIVVDRSPPPVRDSSTTSPATWPAESSARSFARFDCADRSARVSSASCCCDAARAYACPACCSATPAWSAASCSVPSRSLSSSTVCWASAASDLAALTSSQDGPDGAAWAGPAMTTDRPIPSTAMVAIPQENERAEVVMTWNDSFWWR
ncbi:hypothetical protein DEJ30_17235 [Curtobacterium sp. MCPF17_003]|nr:hypothetical protein DEJ30_17235 [Curtobacterium sp. MCPF17_003]